MVGSTTVSRYISRPLYGIGYVCRVALPFVFLKMFFLGEVWSSLSLLILYRKRDIRLIPSHFVPETRVQS